jgi:hypothetical protein
MYIFFLLLGCLLPSILAGCRDLTVGVDTLVYMEPTFNLALSCDSFVSLCEKSYFKPLYLFLVYTISCCTNNVAWLLFFQQLIIMFLIYCSAYKLRHYIPICFSIFVYFFAFFHESLNTVRQTLAQSFCLLSFAYLLRNQLLKSFLLFLPALGFHTTAFIYLVVYPIFYFTNERRVHILRICWVLGILTVIFIMFNIENVIDFFISLNLLENRFVVYIMDNRRDFRQTIFIYCCLMFLILQYTCKKNKVDNVRSRVLFKSLLLICIALSPIGFFVSIYSIRCIFYFLFLSIVFLPMILYDTNRRYLSGKLLIVVLFFLFFYWYQTIIIGGMIYPYTSKILNIG